MLDVVAMGVPRARDLDHKRATGTLRTANFRGTVAGLGALIPAGSFWTQEAGAQHDVLLVMRLSGGVSGVDGLTREPDEKWRLGLLHSGRAPAIAV